jgi:hypothetical protein
VSRWAYEKQLNKVMVGNHRVFFIASLVGADSLPFEEIALICGERLSKVNPAHY